MSRRRLPLVLLVVVLAWYNAGVERLRVEKARVQSVEDVKARWRSFVWPPWVALLTYVSQSNDEVLYHQYTKRILGEGEDRALVDALHHGDLGPSLSRETVEYPPVALLMMLAPRLVARDLPAYRFAFGILGTLLYALLWWLGFLVARRAAPPPDGGRLDGDELARRALFVTLALGPIFLRRLDALPACLTIAALYFVVTRRELAAGLALGLGAGAKLYPLLLAPTWLALLAAQPGGRRRALRLAAPLVLLGGVAAAVRLFGHQAGSGGGAVAMMAERPFQIESLVGGVLAAIGGKGALVWSFGSRNVSLPWADPLARHFQVVLVAGALAVAAVAWRWRRARPEALDEAAEARAFLDFTCVAILAVLLGSKVLSAQYLVWTLPLLALGTRRAYRLLVLVLALTQLLYPVLCDFLNQGAPPLVALLLLRNALLVLLLVVWLRRAQAGRSHMR